MVKTNDGRVYRRNRSPVGPTETNILKNIEVAVDVKLEEEKPNSAIIKDKPDPPGAPIHTNQEESSALP